MSLLHDAIAHVAQTDDRVIKDFHRGACFLRARLSAWRGQHHIRGASVRVGGSEVPVALRNNPNWSLLPEERRERLSALEQQRDKILSQWDVQSHSRRRREDEDGEEGLFRGARFIQVEHVEVCCRQLELLAEQVTRFGLELASEAGYRRVQEHITQHLGEDRGRLLAEALKLVPPRDQIASRYRLSWQRIHLDLSLTDTDLVVEQVAGMVKGPRLRLAGAMESFLEATVVDPDSDKLTARKKRMLRGASVSNLAEELERMDSFRRVVDTPLAEAIGDALEMLPPDRDDAGEASREFAQRLNADKKLVEALARALAQVRRCALDEHAMASLFATANPVELEQVA